MSVYDTIMDISVDWWYDQIEGVGKCAFASLNMKLCSCCKVPEDPDVVYRLMEESLWMHWDCIIYEGRGMLIKNSETSFYFSQDYIMEKANACCH